jgi:SAM-dependent methyltransferase
MLTEQEIKDWYNKRYASRGKGSMRPYESYPIILDYLDVSKGKSLLDVSCGIGFLLLAASKRGLKTSGIDISDEAVKIAKGVSPDSAIFEGKGEDLRFEDKTFDYVTCLGSLEHFLDINKGLHEMRRVAKDDARFCIMVPNSNFIYWKFLRKLGTEQQDINETLLPLNEWQRVFAANGLKVIKVYRDNWQRRKIRVLNSANPIRILKNLTLKIGWFLVPVYWTYQFVFILKKSD